MKSKRKKIVAISIVVAGVLIVLVLLLRSGSANYWITPAELKSGTNTSGESVRVAGKLVEGSLNWDDVNRRIVFKIRAAGEKVILPVIYKGVAPQTLVSDSRVIVEGSMEGGAFNARTVLVKCPENYMTEKAVSGLFRVLKIEGTLYQ